MEKLITRLLMLIMSVSIGAVLTALAGNLDKGVIAVWTPRGLGQALGLGLPSLLVTLGAGGIVAYVLKKPFFGVIASFGLAGFMGFGAVSLGRPYDLLANLIAGTIASSIILLWWGKLGEINSIIRRSPLVSRKLLLVGLTCFLVSVGIIGYFLKNDTNISPTGQEETIESGELVESKPPDLNPEELEEYYAVYQNPFVVYLRKALDAYRVGDISGVNISQLALEEDHTEGIISGLDAFDKSYYQSKFVVLTFNRSISGGVNIQIMFQDKPDRVFWSWVYHLADGNYELRAFNSEYSDPEGIKELNRVYKQFLLDKEHAL